MPKSEFHYVYPLRVRWSEVDMQGVVFHGHYLNYFDVAMTEYLRARDYPYPQGLHENGTDLFVVKTGVEYKGEVKFDDVLAIHTRVARVGRTSLTFAFEVYREGEDDLLANGENVYVHVDAVTRQSTALPETLVERIVALEGAGVRSG